MKPLNQKARAVLDKLIEAFDNPEQLVDTLARATLIPNNSPCRKWSPQNKFIVALHGTGDARGYQQWKETDRFVKKGAKAMYILVPRIKKVQEEDSGEEDTALIGFLAAPVFRLEDTDGKPLPECDPPHIPMLQTVADALNIPVLYTGAVSERVLGAFSSGDDRITLYTHDMSTFYHELSHALHKRTGLLREGNSKEPKRANEIVAEISAAVLVRLFEGEKAGHQAIKYIQSYDASKTHLLGLIPEIMQVVESAININDQVEKGGHDDEQSDSNSHPTQSSADNPSVAI
jgi:hypothetical protein